MVDLYFYDTYALIEILESNQNYARFKNTVGLITTKLNLMELHFYFLRKFGKEDAESVYEDFLKYVIEISDYDYKNASEFKFHNKKSGISYVDAIGYTMAKRLGIKFLTGDKEFKGLDNVEFVK